MVYLPASTQYLGRYFWVTARRRSVAPISICFWGNPDWHNLASKNWWRCDGRAATCSNSEPLAVSSVCLDSRKPPVQRWPVSQGPRQDWASSRFPSHLQTPVVVPEGYTSRLFFAWGDPISDGPSFKPDASNTAADQAVQAGMHHDGMHFFSLPLGSNNPDHGLLVVNHEYRDQRLLYPDGMLTWTVGFAGRLAFPYGTARLRNYGPDIYAGRQNSVPEYPASGKFSEDRQADPISNWPPGLTGARPRSATIVIAKDDGGVFGI